MYWIILATFFTSIVRAENPNIITAFREASGLYLNGVKANHVLKPDLRMALLQLEYHQIDKKILRSRLENINSNTIIITPPEIRTDTKRLSESSVSIHASKVKVIEESDDWTGDDLYLYFFVTDGVVPTGRVTSTYKGLSEGDSFFLSESDRLIYPIGKKASKVNGHLIIDYGVIESDGDDIAEIKKLSLAIIDIAISVYSTYNPEERLLTNLRQEVKALTESLLSLNNDDRLVTSTIVFTADEIDELVKVNSFAEISRQHHSRAELDSWKYKIYFRVLRE